MAEKEALLQGFSRFEKTRWHEETVPGRKIGY